MNTEAFSRHRGLFSAEEQDALRDTRVAIAGLGGVGGIYLATLARMGVGRYHLADKDVYDASNINRQYGENAFILWRWRTTWNVATAKGVNADFANFKLPNGDPAPLIPFGYVVDLTTITKG